jgi:hypothetical protein
MAARRLVSLIAVFGLLPIVAGKIFGSPVSLSFSRFSPPHR